jgi:Cu-Zn family superoxide dismutase
MPLSDLSGFSFSQYSCFPFILAGKTHGAPTDTERMVGDLGNIEADEAGVCNVVISDKLVKLLGPHSVIGRSLVICAGADDTGRGGQDNSLTTGNAGPRVAYGVIGLGQSS